MFLNLNFWVSAINILLFLILFFIPGLCLLWFLQPQWLTEFEFKPGGSTWLSIPISFAISIGLISLLGWAGFYLRWGFFEVKRLYVIIIIFLTIASSIKIWLKFRYSWKLKSKVKFLELLSKKYEIIAAIFLLFIYLLAIYGGAWFSHTADSLGHMAAVRSLIKYNNPVPKQIFYADPVSGMDPTFGTWNLALAIWMSTAGLKVQTMWLLATELLAPLIVLTFILLALELTQNKLVAMISGVFYVILELSGDFRVLAQPNRMGQIFVWLIIILTLLYLNKYGSVKKFPKYIFFVLIGFLGWTSAAIHQQYPPVILSIILPTLVIFLVYDPLKKPGSKNKFLIKWRKNNKDILLLTIVIIIFTAFGLIVRALFTITEKYPVGDLQSRGLQESKKLGLIIQDLTNWFGGPDSYIMIATLLSIILIIYVINGKINNWKGALFIINCSILIPIYSVLSTLSLGRGGLLFSVYIRLQLLIPAFLLVGWVWTLFLFFQNLRFIPSNFKIENIKLLLFFFCFAISIQSIITSVNYAQGGIISLYSPNSIYKYRLSISKNNNLYKTRFDSIQFINSISVDSRILADEGVSYELAALTGKTFIHLPSQHTPLQEKNKNNVAYEDARKFLGGKLSNPEMVDILLKQRVDYIYVDRERYNGPELWVRLPSIPVLDEVAGGENWKAYKLKYEEAKEYLYLYEKINETDDFFKRVDIAKNLREFFTEEDNYIRELHRFIPVASENFIDFVNKGKVYLSPKGPDVVYDFVENFSHDTITSPKNTSIYRTSFVIYYDARGVIFQHPDSKLVYYVYIPYNSYLDFSIALDPAVWEISEGDGVEFIISIDKNGSVSEAFSKYIDPKNEVADRKWLDFSIDLRDFWGDAVQIIFETQSGPQQNDTFDWAGWGEPRIKDQIDYGLRENIITFKN